MGPPKTADEFRGKIRIDECRVILHRGVAEQHVEELPGLKAGRNGGEPDAYFEPSATEIGDVFNFSQCLIQHERIVDGADGHLDALLDGNAFGARGDGLGVAADVINGLDSARGHTGQYKASARRAKPRA